MTTKKMNSHGTVTEPERGPAHGVKVFPTDFWWPVMTHGYRITSCNYYFGDSVRSDDGLLAESEIPTSTIVPADYSEDRPSGFAFRMSTPLTHAPLLFRKLADLDTSNHDAVIEFVNRYGLLKRVGWDDTFFLPESVSADWMARHVAKADQKAVRCFLRGTPWGDFSSETDAALDGIALWDAMSLLDFSSCQHGFRTVLHISDLCKSGDVSMITQLIRCVETFMIQTSDGGWIKTDRRRFRWCLLKDSADPDNSIPINTQEFDHPPPIETVFGVASEFVNKSISDALEGHIRVVMVDDKEGGKAIRLIPDDLLTVAWLQFAQSLERNKSFDRCRGCNEWFSLKPEGPGKSAIKAFCSRKCITKDYRARKEKAEKLLTEGVPVAKVAEQTKTDIATVRKWVKE